MKYTLVSVGDSLTQGFQSFAVFDRAQRHSFPRLMAEYNKDQLTPFKEPYIQFPGFPFNFENFLNKMYELKEKGAKPDEVADLFKGLLRGSVFCSPARVGRNNNLGLYGYTSREVYGTTFAKRAGLFYRMLIEAEEGVPYFGKRFSSLVHDIRRLKYRQKKEEGFSSYNFARDTYYVLCGDRRDKNRSQIEIACEMARQAQKEGRECLITYWAGNNDIMGALLSGDLGFIEDIPEVLRYMKLSLQKLLEQNNNRIAAATIAEMEEVPFLDKKSGHPIFPVYETIPQKTCQKIQQAVRELNQGIRILYRELSGKEGRLALVEADKLFKKLALEGYDVHIRGKSLHLTTEFLWPDDEGRLLKGGLFSLDGAHPGATGYAVIANEFIEAFRNIGVRLNPVDVNKVAEEDTLVNAPPRLIPQFLDLNSELRALAEKLGLFGIIRKIVLDQFDLKRNK